ncbi:hypothetical protein ACSNOH_28115 [Streptomyces sp. URMC 127]|uniref:hypothetical protein n=1 Tax=Streptomyces sp. URMC 127 TaxID=3423402 RepID=UPI003F1BCFF6
MIPRAALLAVGVAGAVLAGTVLGGEAAAAARTRTEPQDPLPTGLGPSNFGLLVVDNSHADSWLEVDRTANALVGSKGTAGSDHDGGGGAIDVRNRDVGGSAQSQPEGGWIGHTPDGEGE